MVRNYLKIAWRNLMKNKIFSLINVLGLTIGITVCMMIFLFIRNEYSVDRFHAKKDNIYRVMRVFDPTRPAVPYLSGPYATALKNEFPGEIKSVVRVMNLSGLISFGENSFKEQDILSVDTNFFSVFTFPLLIGSPTAVLKEPGSVVLTEGLAKKYYGSAEKAMGQVIEMDKSLKLKVTGVAKDLPVNTHLRATMFYPVSNYEQFDWFKVWINNNLFTYALLDDNASKERIEKRFPAFMEKYMGRDMAKMNMKFNLSLTALPDIYFEEHGSFDSVKHGEKTVVRIFISIAALILLIACINFMNLSTIRAVDRSKEVGLRKVMGALRNHLIWQFIGESILLSLISCLLSLGLLKLMMPFYNSILGYELAIAGNIAAISGFLLAIVLVVGFLAGSYPAFFLSSFSPIESLKGKLKLGKGGSAFRQTLVVVQFAISIFLIVGTIMVMKQMNYVRNKQLGYNQEQAIVVPIDNDNIYDKRVSFKRQLEARPEIESVSMMSGEPGGFFDIHTMEAEGQPDIWRSRTEFADFEYVKTLGLKLIAGRDFSPQFVTDSSQSVLVNRTAATSLGFTPEQAIGKWLKNTIRDSARRKIIGVVEDFNFLSLKENMDALVISPAIDHRVFVIRIKTSNIEPALNLIRNIYKANAPDFPMEYSFLDQKFDQLYKQDLKQQTILTAFASLAIFIACLGLFGLASFTAAKRMKEISIRKVLGSSSGNIIYLLSRDLLKPVFIAAIIAIPVAYYAMSLWLENFAYRTGMSWWVFILAASITFMIALITIGIKAVKAAWTNPIKNLKTE
jgi:putative ABC transport system permease protein